MKIEVLSYKFFSMKYLHTAVAFKVAAVRIVKHAMSLVCSMCPTHDSLMRAAMGNGQMARSFFLSEVRESY